MPIPGSLTEQLESLRKGDKTTLKERALPIARAWLIKQRFILRRQFLEEAATKGDAKLMLESYSGVMDTLLSALYALAIGKKPPCLSIIAVGGYGRGELFPYSDIDLLFLYDASQAALAGPVAEFILYILWDLGLTVGQSHRDLDDTIAKAKEDVTIRTNLLDARFIAGDQTIFAEMQSRFAKDVVTGTELSFVEAKFAERQARLQRYGESRYRLEPNVKEGKGGLRDLHTLWWMARYIYPITAIQDLVGMKLLTDEEYRTFDQARQFLCRVRITLHYLAGHAEDRLTFDRQQALAEAMGFIHPSPNYAISRFMRRYFVAVRTVGSMTRVFCALLEEEKKHQPRRSLAWLWHMPWKLGSFRLDGDRLTIRSDVAFEHNPVLMIELFRVAQQHELDIHPHALQLIGRNLRHINDELRHNAKANTLFMEILLGDEPETALRRMSDAGVLGNFIPDFGRVIGQTQFNMYHVFTVDEHTLVAIGILHTIEKGQLKTELPVVTGIMARVFMRRVLYLSLFCHDIAKGRRGDHSELGEKVVEKLAARFGFSQDEIDTCAWLVRYHLLFSHTAFKRDIDDGKTILDFVSLVRTPERLKLLLVLTAADIRAVGPTAWNAWKAELLRELYRRAEQCMGTGVVALKEHQEDQFRQDLMKKLPGWTEADVDHYLEQGNHSFWANIDITRHAVIARMLREAKTMPLPLLVDTYHDYERSVTEIIVATQDQPGLFSKIAGAMALSGANIISAKIFTLKHGMVVDVFQVQDVMGQVLDRPDRLAKMSVYLEQTLSGELDLSESFNERILDYANARRHALPVPGQIFIENNASNIYSVIELTGQDRPGFLYQVTQAIADLGLTIATAHITTYGSQVADVFYVKDIFGMKIDHGAKLKAVREALLAAINGN